MELRRSADYHSGLKPSISSALVGWLGGSINTFTISALERASGVPRSTIHFYITEELLPKPAKTAASRSLYTEKHVELLRRITSLKQSGLSLSEIKEELQEDLALTEGVGIDLAAHEYERVHAEILKTATEEFAANGYEDTHLSTIVKRIGITPHVFYGHFASKLQLLAECFRQMVDVNLQLVETKLETTSDLAERLLARLASNAALHTLQSEAVSLIRTESSEPPSDVSGALIETYARIVEQVAADIARCALRAVSCQRSDRVARLQHAGRVRQHATPGIVGRQIRSRRPVSRTPVALPGDARGTRRPSRHRQRGRSL